MNLNPYLQIIRKELKRLANPEKGKFYQGFFKTQQGGYGEGDIFLGVTVPDMRKVSKRLVKGGIFDDFLILSISEKLLQSAVHEERFLSLQTMKELYKKEYEVREEIIAMYMRNLKYINNRDLVDTSSYFLLGDWCLRNQEEGRILELVELGKKPSPPSPLYPKHRDSQKVASREGEILWRRRIAMVSTMRYLRAEKFALCLEVAEILLQQQIKIDPKTEWGGREGRELTNKAVGRLMRELGKRRIDLLRDFLKKYAKIMPRTMLRYMLEKMDREEKDTWMGKKQAKQKQQKNKKALEQKKKRESKKFIIQFESTLSDVQREILEKLRACFLGVDAREMWQRNTIVRKLSNKSWRYINTKNTEKIVLGCGKRKMLEKVNPMISGLRDEVGKVVGKIFLFSIDDVKKKGVEELVKMSG